ncbi:hypothetical protein SJ203_13745, partial [Klebsiella pneumoniae]|nr:hypothetical protein [Klebsiella pneumoniae]
MGSLFKQIYRYTRPRAYRHNENLWPFTRIARAPSGEISALRYKGKTVPLVSLSALKNSMQGEVLLTATGPSTGTVAKLAMRQPFVLFKGLTFQKLCLP